jgi:phosphoserine phosphatase
MPDHLIVIRTAATDYERQGRVRGSLDIPPCSEGLAEVTALADRLATAPPEAIYTAPTACGIQTGRIIANRCGVSPKRSLQPRLYRQWQDDPWSVAPPEGELLEEASARVEEALEKLFKRHPAGRIAVVVPPPLDAIVRWLVSGSPLGDLWQPNAAQDALAVLPVAAQWRIGGVPASATPAPVSDQAPATAG